MILPSEYRIAKRVGYPSNRSENEPKEDNEMMKPISKQAAKPHKRSLNVRCGKSDATPSSSSAGATNGTFIRGRDIEDI